MIGPIVSQGAARFRFIRRTAQTLLAACACLVAVGATALANDTTATTGAGGLEITRTDAIDMVSEDLFVSAEQIRVRYIFRNRTQAPVETIIAFPMPDRPLSDEYGGDVAFPSDFQTRVAGVAVHARLERKAMVNGVDHRSLLEELGIPIAPDNIMAVVQVMDGLTPETRAQLIKRGLAGEEEWDDDGKGMKKHLIPLWTVQDKYWWNQRFPAGKPLRIDHSYRPGTGGAVETPLGFPNYRNSEDAKRAMATYCIEPSFLAALDQKARKDMMQGPGLPDRRIDYILTTGSNWRSPIGEFRLVVDKGKAGNLVSFCGQGVRKISSTRFEMRRKNWRPDKDLHVLIVEPVKP